MQPGCPQKKFKADVTVHVVACFGLATKAKKTSKTKKNTYCLFAARSQGNRKTCCVEVQQGVATVVAKVKTHDNWVICHTIGVMCESANVVRLNLLVYSCQLKRHSAGHINALHVATPGNVRAAVRCAACRTRLRPSSLTWQRWNA